MTTTQFASAFRSRHGRRIREGCIYIKFPCGWLLAEFRAKLAFHSPAENVHPETSQFYPRRIAVDVKEAHANFEALGPGTLVVDMTLVDGSKWKGRFFVTPAVRAGLSSPVFAGAAFEADRLKGSSLVEIVSIVALGIGPNGPVSFTFSDGRDQPGRPAARIGGFEIFSDGEGVVAAAGGGTWERIA